MWVSYGATAPEPTTAACRSGTPQTTGAPGRRRARRRRRAAAGRARSPSARSSGSRARSRRVLATSESTYPSGAPRRLSVSHDAIIEAGVAAARAGEPQAQIVDRLEDDRGLCVHLGQPRLQQQRVAGGVGAARVGAPPVRRRKASTFCGAKPPDVERSADDLAHEVAGARVGPEQDLADGLAVGADRHRRGPLPGDRDRVQLVAVGAGARDRLAGRLDAGRPTTRRRPGSPPPSSPMLHVDGAHGRAAHLALERDHGDLGAAVAQVDREDPALAQSGGLSVGATACMASSTLNITDVTSSLPLGLPPKPYTAPDLADSPLCFLA